MRIRRVFAEFLGTMILSMGICLKSGAAAAMGAALWTAIIGTGFVSGGAFNPAITTSVLLVGIFKNKLSKWEILEQLTFYVAHILGGMIGACLSWAIKEETWPLAIPSTSTVGQAYLAETCGTAILILVAMIGGELRDSAFIGTLAVASTLYLDGLVLASISGACVNPAIGIGANFADALNLGSERAQHLWLYVCAPLTGSVIAAIFYLIIKPELDKIYQQKEEAT
jgi:glycerol uptake facilitator-like aquaporin